MNATDLNALFNERAQKDAHAAWIAACRSEILSARKEASTNDEAALVLARRHTPEVLSQILYAAMCFWHKDAHPFCRKKQDCDLNLAIKDATLRMAKASPSSKTHLLYRKLVAEASLLEIATKARLEAVVQEEKWQEDLFENLADALKQDPDLKKGALGKNAWPYFPEGDPKGAKAVHPHAPDYFIDTIAKAIWDLNPASIAATVSGTMQNLVTFPAKNLFRIRPHVYSELFLESSDPKALKQRDQHGSYGFDKKQGTATYHVNARRVYTCRTLPCFITMCAHETLHLLQTSYAFGLGDRIKSSVFYAEKLSFDAKEKAKAFPFDRPARPYIGPPDLLPVYFYRPTEFYAYGLASRLECALCETWSLAPSRQSRDYVEKYHNGILGGRLKGQAPGCGL